MREVRDCWCIQIDVTNMCGHSCSNCTHLVKNAKPWKMDMDRFQKSLDSLCGYTGIVGVIGGNPALHPEFGEILDRLEATVPKERRGIWISTFGKDKQFEPRVRGMCDPNHIYFNDHLKPNKHQPILVASKDVIHDPIERARLIDNCWLADKWSPSINPKGCYRCEVMGAFDMALDLNLGLPVEDGWWKRPLHDFKQQVETFCNRCGQCVPMDRRIDAEEKDDVSPSNLDVANPSRSVIFNVSEYRQSEVVNWFPCEYRKGIEKPVGVVVSVNYANCLERILPYNLRHLDSLFVVTSPDDIETKEVCSRYPKIKVVETDIFYRHGAKFNKGAAVEIALMMIPRDKWCLIFDSDILFPADMFLLEELDKNKIYGATRHMVYSEEQLSMATFDRNFQLDGIEAAETNNIIVGAFQLFHPTSSFLTEYDVRPWYGVNYANASWCDNVFVFKWPDSAKVILPIKTIHLGHRHNWIGTVEGKFPRPETEYIRSEEHNPLSGVSVDDIMVEVEAEFQRISGVGV